MQRSEKSHRKVFFLAFFILFVFVGIFLVRGNYMNVLFSFFFSNGIELKKANSHINILLMGRGGGTHDGPDLTDTIIFASVDEKKNRVSMVSIPRDLWVPDLQAKINTAYAFGKEKDSKGGGITLSRAVMSKIVGEPIDYVVVVDFSGFVKAVDEVGGLDITVDRAFDDYEYPLEDKREELCGHTLEEATELIATMSATEVFPCRYTHVHVYSGPQHMNGERALIFVRSRYGDNGEGSDFARSKRQQKAIQAFREKVLSLGILLNPIKAINLYHLLEKSIDTNIASSEFDDFIKLAVQMKDAKIHPVVLQIEDEKGKPGLLVHPEFGEFGGSWVLIPKAGEGNYNEIQSFVDCVSNSDICPTPTQ